MEEHVKDKIRELLVNQIERTEWGSMVNDIERYQKIKELAINAFRAVLLLCPQQVKVLIQNKITRLEDSDPIFEFEELEGFLKLVHIHTTSLLSHTDDDKVHDFAAPHQAIGYLDRLVRINENKKYSELNVSSLGAAMGFELNGLKVHLEKIDWKKGWKD